MLTPGTFLTITGKPVFTAERESIITAVILHNSHAENSITYTVHLCANSARPADANIVLVDSLAAGSSVRVTDLEKLVFDTGDCLFISATADFIINCVVNYTPL